jgi:hypothetical protein
MAEDRTLRTLRSPTHPQRSRLSDMAKTDYTCYVCGVDVTEKQVHFIVHPIRGGHLLLHPGDEEKYDQGEGQHDTGNLGAQPVGPSCVKKFKLQEWAVRHDPTTVTK